MLPRIWRAYFLLSSVQRLYACLARANLDGFGSVRWGAKRRLNTHRIHLRTHSRCRHTSFMKINHIDVQEGAKPSVFRTQLVFLFCVGRFFVWFFSLLVSGEICYTARCLAIGRHKQRLAINHTHRGTSARARAAAGGTRGRSNSVGRGRTS